MLSVAHTFISIPLGIHMQNPLLIFLAAFVLHLFLDTLLHWNLYPERWGKAFYPLAMVDVFGGAALAWLIMGGEIFSLPILAAIAGGNMPDVFHGLWEIAGRQRQQKPLLRWMTPFFKFHDSLQLETTRPLLGLPIQAALIIVALLIT